MSARKSTTAAAAEAEPKKTPPRPWKDTAPLTPAASRAAARALALRKNAWQACTSWARPYRRNRPAQTNCGGALPQRSVELLRVVGGLRSRGVRRHAFMLRLPAARRPRFVQTSPGWFPPGALQRSMQFIPAEPTPNRRILEMFKSFLHSTYVFKIDFFAYIFFHTKFRT